MNEGKADNGNGGKTPQKAKPQRSKAVVPASQGQAADTPQSAKAQVPARVSQARGAVPAKATALARPAPQSSSARISGPAMAARPARLSKVARSLAAAADAAPMEDYEDEPDPLWTVICGLSRLTAGALIVLAIVVWGRVVGALPSALTLDWAAPGGPWLITLLAAIAFPVCAVGLWLLSRWGAVVFIGSLALTAYNAVQPISIIPHGTLVAALLGALFAVLAVLVTVRTIQQLRDEQGAP
ncbi:MAG: hypothetical protein AAF580_03035 [Pseudomonadota bacterium]